MKLKEFLEENRIRQTEMALKLDISNGYLSTLVQGDVGMPSLPLALDIEAATRGKVTCKDWGYASSVEAFALVSSDIVAEGGAA